MTIINLLVNLLLISSNQKSEGRSIVHRKYYIWLPIGDLINLPCDPFISRADRNKSLQVILMLSAVEWYDIGGFYLHTGFILPIRALSQRYFHGLVCNILDNSGEVVRRIEHHVTIHHQPTILWAYRINLVKSKIIPDDLLKKNIEDLFRKISLQCNTLCLEAEFCDYQFIYFHKSPYDEYLLNNEDRHDAETEEQMKKMEVDSQSISFYFKVSFTRYRELLMDPHLDKFKGYVAKLQKIFFGKLKKKIFATYLNNLSFFDTKFHTLFKIEIVCPAGSEEREGYIFCHECFPGYFAKPGGKCQPCEYGTFQSFAGSSECNKCPNIYKTLQRASTKEEECIFDGPYLSAAFYYFSGRIWNNLITSHRTFSITFIIVTLIYIIISTLIIGWLSYRIHLYRKIRRRRHLAFEQLLSVCTVGHLNLNLDVNQI